MSAVLVKYGLLSVIVLLIVGGIFVGGRESGRAEYTAGGVAQQVAADKANQAQRDRDTQARIDQQVAIGIQGQKDENKRLQALYDGRDADARKWYANWLRERAAKSSANPVVRPAPAPGAGTGTNAGPVDCSALAGRLEFYETVITHDLDEAVAEKQKADDQIASLLTQRRIDEQNR